MNVNAVKTLLVPMSDHQFEEWLLRHRGEAGHEESVTLAEVGLDALAHLAVVERDGVRDSRPTKPL